MDRPAQSLYQLNEGKVFWDPYKHLRVNGTHPYYKWPCHEGCIDRKIPPNPIHHVKRPTEQFERFDVRRFPSSKFTMKSKLDAMRYHPRYNGFRPRGSGNSDDPLDLTWIFYPPEGEELFIAQSQVDDSQATTQEPTKDKKGRFAVKDPFDAA